VKAEQHLPPRPAMNEDQSGVPARPFGAKQLSMNFDTVLRLENYWFGRSEIASRRSRPEWS